MIAEGNLIKTPYYSPWFSPETENVDFGQKGYHIMKGHLKPLLQWNRKLCVILHFLRFPYAFLAEIGVLIPNAADMDFSGDCFNGVLNNNAYESRVLRQWLVEQGKSVADMLGECCGRLQADQYQAPFYQTLSPDTHTCVSCALQSFKQLAYCYRRDIPNSQLPGIIMSVVV